MLSSQSAELPWLYDWLFGGHTGFAWRKRTLNDPVRPQNDLEGYKAPPLPIPIGLQCLEVFDNRPALIILELVTERMAAVAASGLSGVVNLASLIGGKVLRRFLQ
jgi:hypothetical protein